MSTITRLNTFGSVGFNTVEAKADWGSDSVRIEMFKVKDLYPIFLKANSPVSGFILPGFDPSLDLSDAARPMSFGPYRDINMVDHKTNTPSFTDWVYFVSGYTFYGNSLSSFISPSMIGQVDPIVELRKHVYRLKYTDMQEFKKYEFLLQPGSKKDDKRALPKIGTLALMNVWCANPNEKAKDAGVVTNRVLVLKSTAFEQLSAALNEYQPSALKEPRDHAWPMFLRGDVTNPAQALEWRIATHVGSNGFQTNVLDFGSVTMIPGGQMVFNGRSAQLPAEALRGRYDLGDLQNVLYVPSTEEVVNLLVEDALIPYELICDVCGRYVDSMPAKKAGAKYPAPAASAQPTYQQPAYPQQPAYQQVAYQPQQPAYQQPTYQPQQNMMTAGPAQPYQHQPAYQQPVAPQQHVMPAPQQTYQQNAMPTAPAQPYQQAQPAYQQATYQPQQTSPVNPLLQDDPNDDIPYGDAPAAPAASSASGNPDLSKLTAEEAARYTELMDAVGTGACLPVADYNELERLVIKARG